MDAPASEPAARLGGAPGVLSRGRIEFATGLSAALVLLAAARLLWAAHAQRRPLIGSHSPSDLLPILQFHGSLRDWFPRGFWDLIQASNLKPPLYYAGVAILAAPFERLPVLAPAAVNAVCMVWTAGLLRRELGRRAGPWAAAMGVGAWLSLPGVVGLGSHAGCEPLHALLLLAFVRGLCRLLDVPSLRRALGLGLLLGAGILVKWNFAAFALPPIAMAGASALAGGGGLRRLGWLGLAVATGCLLAAPWVFGVASARSAQVMLVSEPVGMPGLLPGLGYYWNELRFWLLGPQTLPLAGVAVAAGFAARRRPERGLLLHLAAVLGVLLPHAALAHRELRYLLPLTPSLVLVLLAPGGTLWERSRAWSAALSVAVLLLFAGTFLKPALREAPAWPSVSENPWDLVVWPDRRDHGTEAFFAPLDGSRDEAGPAPCALLDSGGARAADLHVWLSTELMARRVLPLGPDSENPDAGSCRWAIAAGVPRSSPALDPVRRLVLEWPKLPPGEREMTLFRRGESP